MSEIRDEIKRNTPNVAFGVGAGAGMLAHSKSRFKNNRSLAAISAVGGGAAAYAAGLRATGKKLDKDTAPVLYSLGGGAAAVAAHDAILRRRSGGTASFNPLLRNAVGSAGAIAGGIAAIKAHSKKKKEISDSMSKAAGNLLFNPREKPSVTQKEQQRVQFDKIKNNRTTGNGSIGHRNDLTHKRQGVNERHSNTPAAQ